MNKKELRKELELILVKTIEEVLTKRNSTIPAKIRKTTFEASKSVAKKFYKALKTKAPKKITKPAAQKSKAPTKAAVKKRAIKSKK
jgi:hypothetical protein